METKKQNLLDLGIPACKDFLVSIGEPAYRAQQLIHWIHQRGVIELDQMTNLSKSLCAKLREHAEIVLPTIAMERRAEDDTVKWLLRLKDCNAIETVFIPERGRGTLCVSSQVGCGLNCSFCATGKEGFNRNLTVAEIIGQVWIAVRRLKELEGDFKVTNVVMMGMGEPLLNYQPVFDAMELMLEDLAYGLSKYKVTLSTSGLIPAIQKLRQESQVSLAVSLHAPTNELRNELVPLNKKYPLEQLIPVCRDYYPRDSKRVVTFEYVMLAGVNDSDEQAHQLIRLLANVPCKINLIPFNPFPKTEYQRSSSETIEHFRRILLQAGLKAWTRKTRGDDIEGACGQLAGDVTDRTGRNKRWQLTGKLVPVSH